MRRLALTTPDERRQSAAEFRVRLGDRPAWLWPRELDDPLAARRRRPRGPRQAARGRHVPRWRRHGTDNLGGREPGLYIPVIVNLATVFISRIIPSSCGNRRNLF